MSAVRRCAKCPERSASSAVITLVAIDSQGQGLYACRKHRAALAAPPRDVLTQLAQLQDMARRGRPQAAARPAP